MAKRLIEADFPLEQASLDSLHEKNVRHGHISTLHLWPARRPLAACRAALLATLLPDPGTDEARKRLLERIGGHVKQRRETKVLPGQEIAVERRETEGGVLHWGNESGPEMDALRAEIRAAFGGRAPRVHDPFAGGGAIPLEAMRLGCEVTASDLSPVAWFLLRCTLEYPQKLAGKTWPLPEFILRDRGFMEEFFTARKVPKKLLAGELEKLGHGEAQSPALDGLDVSSPRLSADLAWQVRAWGAWVLERARGDLRRFYPVISGEAPVAYLWARTVTCRNCRATMPLLKTRWLCKKPKKRVMLGMTPNAARTGVEFRVEDLGAEGAARGRTAQRAAQRREDEKRLGAGTMSRAGARCPCCGQVSMSMADIRLEGQAGRLGAVMTAVVVEREGTKAYRLPAEDEVRMAEAAAGELEALYREIPFGLPAEPTPEGGVGASRAFSVRGYGLTRWCDLFTARQLLALGTFVKHTRAAREHMPAELREPVGAYLAAAVDRLADYSSSICSWHNGREIIGHTFARFALPAVWDFVEVATLSEHTGGFPSALGWVVGYAERGSTASGTGRAELASAVSCGASGLDVVATDPPYYDAIPYSDLMDFFYVWLRRSLHGLSLEYDEAFREPLGPKWNEAANDGELIDDASRFGGDAARSKKNYEDGMARAFAACHGALGADGRLVIVFANKQPDAWETLVGALIRAGFVVTASWPIRTEMSNRMRALASAALSSSVWLVCRKRDANARAGWDEAVLEGMQAKIKEKLRGFWDAGIRGPDFVWAATGPALEAFSEHPVVKLAHKAGGVMTVGEFLRHARRMVVDFIVGNVLPAGEGEAAALDDVTAYYLLHRHSFGLADAPAGACILYATSCNVSDRELVQRGLLAKTTAQAEGEDGEKGQEAEAPGGAKCFRLRGWKDRQGASFGYQGENGRRVPLIDRVHRLAQLWAAGSQGDVDAYIEAEGLRREALLPYVLQAVIELAGAEGARDEQTKLEAIAKHIQGRGQLGAVQGEMSYEHGN